MVKKHPRIHSAFERTSTSIHLLIFTAVALVLYFETEWLFLDYEYAFNRVITSLIFAILITSQALTKTESPLNLSNITFAKNWGKYTYGIYLLHPIAIIFADVPARIFKVSQQDFISTFSIGLVAFVFTLIISKLSYRYYESWFLNLKKKYQLVKSRSSDSE
jgi:peptidoglycan/LPS O-acetylase OafA/YrhL